MKASASRETSQSGDGLVAVLMPKEKASGIRAFGALKPGQVYRVVPAEALRLVNVKRFEYASDEDRRRATAYAAEQAQPAEADGLPDTAASAAAADATTED